MPCNEVTDLGKIAQYQAWLETCLRGGILIPQVVLHIGNSRQKKCDIWWHPTGGHFVGFDKIGAPDGKRKPTFWNAFGIANPMPLAGGHLTISVEINLKMHRKARPEGILLACGDNEVFLGHLGRITHDKLRPDLKMYHSIKSRIVKIGQKEVIRIAPFGDCDAFLKELSSFVRDVQTIRIGL